MTRPMTDIFAENLRNQLYLTGKTQADLARALKTSETSVSQWINAKAVPRPTMVDRICSALRCKREDLMIDHSKSVLIAPEDILAEEMHNRPELYTIFNAIMKMPSSDVELIEAIVKRLSL